MVEPNRFFQPVFEENLKKYPSVKLDRYIIGKVEDMSEISDGSIDVVMSTCVLCSVDNTEETLKEIQRVLVSVIIIQLKFLKYSNMILYFTLCEHWLGR